MLTSQRAATIAWRVETFIFVEIDATREFGPIYAEGDLNEFSRIRCNTKQTKNIRKEKYLLTCWDEEKSQLKWNPCTWKEISAVRRYNGICDGNIARTTHTRSDRTDTRIINNIEKGRGDLLFYNTNRLNVSDHEGRLLPSMRRVYSRPECGAIAKLRLPENRHLRWDYKMPVVESQ